MGFISFIGILVSVDKYYTQRGIVEACICQLESVIHIDDHDIVIEPSAGNGSFIPSIQRIAKNYRFYDILPEHDEIEKQDFLTLDTAFLHQYQQIHVLGNPPFGRQSSLAIQFIRKCCTFASTIAFILPKSFKKESMKRTFDRFFHLIYEMDLPQNSFDVNGKEHDVPCVFQIWIRKETERPVPEKAEPRGFRFVRKTDPHHIAFRRVGVNAGAITTDTIHKSIQSHYFIQFTNEQPLSDNLQQLRQVHFQFNNSVGPKSISKTELIDEFNKFM